MYSFNRYANSFVDYVNSEFSFVEVVRNPLAPIDSRSEPYKEIKLITKDGKDLGKAPVVQFMELVLKETEGKHFCISWRDYPSCSLDRVTGQHILQTAFTVM